MHTTARTIHAAILARWGVQCGRDHAVWAGSLTGRAGWQEENEQLLSIHRTSPVNVTVTFALFPVGPAAPAGPRSHKFVPVDCRYRGDNSQCALY